MAPAPRSSSCARFHLGRLATQVQRLSTKSQPLLPDRLPRRRSTKAACGADATGFKLYHNSTKKCGLNGLRWREILRKYLNPNLEIVTPGRHDVIGSAHGDAAAMVRNSAPQWIAHVSTPGRRPPQPGSYAGLAITTDGIVSMRSADMNADGREDLVWLKRPGGPAKARSRSRLATVSTTA